jgi:hypothetical protein
MNENTIYYDYADSPGQCPASEVREILERNSGNRIFAIKISGMREEDGWLQVSSDLLLKMLDDKDIVVTKVSPNLSRISPELLGHVVETIDGIRSLISTCAKPE